MCHLQSGSTSKSEQINWHWNVTSTERKGNYQDNTKTPKKLKPPQNKSKHKNHKKTNPRGKAKIKKTHKQKEPPHHHHPPKKKEPRKQNKKKHTNQKKKGGGGKQPRGRRWY